MHRSRILAVLIAGWTIGGCSAETPPSGVSAPNQAMTGWYYVHAGTGYFQPCGESRSMSVAASVDLSKRAADFGLTEDNPVYVRMHGTVREGALQVASVEQFGSTTPVRQCALTGLVLPNDSR